MASDMVIDGTTYLPSKRVAEISGYAQDYIGQLCRRGLVQAQRIGGLWYVNLDSLYEYKKKADSYVPVAPRPAVQAENSLISLDGKDFVSTARAAEITGYAQDYVGQLARESGVLSKQVGSRWYVERQALLEHKKHKDALLAAVQAEAVGLSREAKKSIVQPESLGNASNSIELPPMNYTTESDDLMPMVQSRAKGEDVGQNVAVPAQIPIRVLRTQPRAQQSDYPPKGRGMRIAMIGTTVATIAIFLTIGFVSIKDSAIYARGAAEGGFAAAGVPVQALDTLSRALESIFVPSVTYIRPK